MRVPLALRSRQRARSGSRHGLRYGLAVAATVIVILILGVIAIAAVVRHPDGHVSASQSTRGPGAKPTPTDPLVSMEFKCSASIGLGISGAPPVARVNAVRAERRAGFDRVTIAFTNARPGGVTVTAQNSATFVGADGSPITLSGTSGTLVTFKGADSRTDYHGPADIKVDLATVLELRKVEDSGTTVQWAVGVASPACFRAMFYSSPVRLVVDFRAE